ncbi:MAG: hypothetical protein LBO66_01380 [Deltaproteobacteria bacterium]|nr:hypothetical protein [Deltaproteobacteria bacterium]
MSAEFNTIGPKAAPLPNPQAKSAQREEMIGEILAKMRARTPVAAPPPPQINSGAPPLYYVKGMYVNLYV